QRECLHLLPLGHFVADQALAGGRMILEELERLVHSVEPYYGQDAAVAEADIGNDVSSAAIVEIVEGQVAADQPQAGGQQAHLAGVVDGCYGPARLQGSRARQPT